MSQQEPSYNLYLIGSLLASFVGAGILVIIAGTASLKSTIFIALPLTALINLVIFLVIGSPLFFILRGTQWFRFWVFATVGAIIPNIFICPPIFNDLLSVKFTFSGVANVAACWWYINRSTSAEKRVAP